MSKAMQAWGFLKLVSGAGVSEDRQQSGFEKQAMGKVWSLLKAPWTSKNAVDLPIADQDALLCAYLAEQAYLKPNLRDDSVQGFKNITSQLTLDDDWKDDVRHAVYWNEESGDMIVAIRGTANGMDLLTDTSFLFGALREPDIQQPLEYMQAAAAKVGFENISSIRFAGHSLGGAKAIMALRSVLQGSGAPNILKFLVDASAAPEYEGLVSAKSSHVFNPATTVECGAGGDESVASLFNQSESAQPVTIHRMVGDPVSAGDYGQHNVVNYKRPWPNAKGGARAKLRGFATFICKVHSMANFSPDSAAELAAIEGDCEEVPDDE
jgi:hypothetical protein